MKHLTVHLDRETSERAGAGGMFQVISITDEDGKDLTDLVDQGTHYSNLSELQAKLTNKIGEPVTVEEV